eukprot:3785896-Rhodomonas_salina.1
MHTIGGHVPVRDGVRERPPKSALGTKPILTRDLLRGYAHSGPGLGIPINRVPGYWGIFNTGMGTIFWVPRAGYQ